MAAVATATWETRSCSTSLLQGAAVDDRFDDACGAYIGL
jgi:hypothetical protein